MLDKVFWEFFEKSGNIDAYMAYRNELDPMDNDWEEPDCFRVYNDSQDGDGLTEQKWFNGRQLAED